MTKQQQCMRDERIAKLVVSKPSLPYSVIAERLGCSQKTISTVALRLGVRRVTHRARSGHARV